MIFTEKFATPLYEVLIDKVCMLKCKELMKGAEALLEEACAALKIGLTVFYREDVLYLGMYVCQIVLNDELFITAQSGATRDISYRLAAREFVNLCFAKRNLKLKFPSNDQDLFYDEIKMSFENIQLTNFLRNETLKIFKDLNQNGYSPMINSMKYEHIKIKLRENGLNLTEDYVIKENDVKCSIVLNGTLLIQQDDGKDKKEALENTIISFFTAYEIISTKDVIDSSTPIESLTKKKILQQLSQLFNKKKTDLSDSKNYWDIILECANSLNLNLTVKCGEIKINNVLIVDVKEVNEYVGNIKCGKEFVRLLNEVKEERKPLPQILHPNISQTTLVKEERKPLPQILHPKISQTTLVDTKVLPTILISQSSVTSQESEKVSPIAIQHQTSVPPPPILNFTKTAKICTKIEREEIINIVALSTNEEFMKDPSQSLWNVLNRQCHKSNIIIEPRYTFNDIFIVCTLIFKVWKIVSGFGSVRNSAREAASRNLINWYLTAI